MVREQSQECLMATLEKKIARSYNNVTGILVLEQGKTKYEKYFKGYTASDTVHVASVTKSIVSALYGIALNQGCIKSIEEPVRTFFPEYQVKEGERTMQKVTIRNMLTMTAPYKCRVEPYAKFFSSENWMNTALDLLGGKKPIGEFRYAPIVGSHILAGILVNATGRSLLEYANENLFEPLEIRVKGNIVLKDKEEHIAFAKRKDISGWVVDPQGINTPSWGLTLTARDMAKIGQLYLQHGEWKGKQIVPSDWIKASTSMHSRWKKLSYGYLWWVIDEKEQIYAALGQGGNAIYVNAKKNRVIVVTALMRRHDKDPITFIQKYIEPIFNK